MIHDAQLDYYGRRLATASSDRTIRVFDVSGDKQTLLAVLKGHDGPVWAVQWSHPKYGPVLASCSYDGRVIVWKEATAGSWIKVYEDTIGAPVTSIAWAPHSYGLILAAGAADGHVTIFQHRPDNQWAKQTVSAHPAHKGGVTAVSWAPERATASLPGGGATVTLAPLRLVTGGCDNRIRIWRYEEGGKYVEAEAKTTFVNGDNAHADRVRDVAWAPSLGMPSSTIASASEDKTVVIWVEDANGLWSKGKTLQFDNKVWRVSWSVMGNILAVSHGDNKVSLWKESVDGDWKALSSPKEAEDALKPRPELKSEH